MFSKQLRSDVIISYCLRVEKRQQGKVEQTDHPQENISLLLIAPYRSENTYFVSTNFSVLSSSKKLFLSLSIRS